MSKLGKANTLAEILTSIIGDIVTDANKHVVEEGWFGRSLHHGYHHDTNKAPDTGIAPNCVADRNSIDME